jgi:hypothetical protein
MRRNGWIEHHDRKALVLLGVVQFDKELFNIATQFKPFFCFRHLSIGSTEIAKYE